MWLHVVSLRIGSVVPRALVEKRIRALRRHYGVMAPRLVVRRHVGRGWYVFALLGLSLAMQLLGWGMARHQGLSAAGQDFGRLQEQLSRQEAELLSLRATTGVELSAVSIERAAQQKLLARVKELEAENAVLKEDMRVFERVLPVAGEPGAVSIENFRVTADPVGQYRYRFLLVFSPDKQFPEFQGRLRILAHYTLSDKTVQLALPLKKGDEEIRLKKMQRREGEFKLPAGATLVGLEAHVLQGDTLKFKRVAKL